MIVTVSVLPGAKVFTMSVIGAHHRHDFDQEYNTMDAVWTAARKVGEAEQDWTVNNSKGWAR